MLVPTARRQLVHLTASQTTQTVNRTAVFEVFQRRPECTDYAQLQRKFFNKKKKTKKNFNGSKNINNNKQKKKTRRRHMQGAGQIGNNCFDSFWVRGNNLKNRRAGNLGMGFDWLNQCGFVETIRQSRVNSTFLFSPN